MRIFVTGADGFLGSHLVERLLKAGYEVTALCQYNSFGSVGWLEDLIVQPELCSRLSIKFGDVRDSGFIRKLIKENDLVIHLAALIAIPYSFQAPRSYVDTNVLGTLNVAEGCVEAGVRLIHTSTSEVYGTAQSVPMNEDHPINAQSPYAASKVAADQIVQSFVDSFGLDALTIRPFNAFGPRQSTRAVIPSIITQLLNGDGTVMLGDKTTTRDFNFVEDLCFGFERGVTSGEGLKTVVNLGTSNEISIEEIAVAIASILDKELVINEVHERMRPGTSEVKRLCADNNKALKLLGWSPSERTLLDNLKLTIDWYSDAANIKKFKPGFFF